MIQGVIDVYSAIKQDLRPTPATAHYVFSLHDIARVFEGMMLMSPKSKVKSKREKMSTLDMTSSRSDMRGSKCFTLHCDQINKSISSFGVHMSVGIFTAWVFVMHGNFCWGGIWGTYPSNNGTCMDCHTLGFDGNTSVNFQNLALFYV